ncbi:hypothetical protein MRB53_040659 [Persea americana]|nr:hypothetical protein MRB53_040659 [Persea americana]
MLARRAAPLMTRQALGRGVRWAHIENTHETVSAILREESCCLETKGHIDAHGLSSLAVTTIRTRSQAQAGSCHRSCILYVIWVLTAFHCREISAKVSQVVLTHVITN